MQPRSRAIDLPFRVGPGGAIAFSKSEEDRIKNLLISVLGTYFGERVMRPDLGTDIAGYQFETFGSNAANEFDDTRETIQAAISAWLPGVELLEVIEPDEIDIDGTLTIEVRYALNGVEDVLELDIPVLED